MDKIEIPKAMVEAVRRFANQDIAHDFFVQHRWPNGAACPLDGCGSMSVAYMPKRKRWYCRDCKGQFTAKTRTIFEDSPIGFDKWLPAFWLIASNRNGISSHELARALDVTQKTGWFMLHRIREAMADKSFTRFAGPVELDETFVGGRRRHGNVGRKTARGKSLGPAVDKTTVFGIMQRKGDVRAFVVPSVRLKTLGDKVREHVVPGGTIYTDDTLAYKGMSDEYVHHVINHAYEYVRGHVHTNSIEAFWSLLKRTLRGTYVSARPEHLQRYVEEAVFRFNERKNTDGPRFVKATKGADGKRLTYKTLTARTNETG